MQAIGASVVLRSRRLIVPAQGYVAFREDEDDDDELVTPRHERECDDHLETG